MKNNLVVLFVFFFQCQFLVAQIKETKIITGTIVSNTVKLDGITVVNASTKILVVSNQNGHFSILAKEGDILSFSAVNYEALRKIITKNEFANAAITVDLTPKSIELEEVIINKNSNITAENLGIIPRGQIKLTPAERKVFTATDGTDAILNYFSGRTKMLKKEVAVEKKEFLMAKLEVLFENKYYIETLKIPEELIKGFQYYCVEDAGFAKSLNDNNKTMSMFWIVGLASAYNNDRKND